MLQACSLVLLSLLLQLRRLLLVLLRGGEDAQHVTDQVERPGHERAVAHGRVRARERLHVRNGLGRGAQTHPAVRVQGLRLQRRRQWLLRMLMRSRCCSCCCCCWECKCRCCCCC